MAKSTAKDAQALVQSLRSAYSATPTNLKIIDLYVIFAVLTAVIQLAYMAIVWIISIQFIPLRSSLLHWHCCACSLSPDSSEQREQGIQGFATRTCFCRFCALQSRTSFGDNELPWVDRLKDLLLRRWPAN